MLSWVMLDSVQYSNAVSTIFSSLQVIINGVPLGKDFENLDRYVCASTDKLDR